ncbi:MAG: poly-beta-1,6-N-acetyl-D-glucosamine N-deacetylase PgaB, partial [Candidatus Omnitrophica bacterium]|nr:poly-beta-1,6-N-acetyl-D-glucosamine N-deacetylase PgaB [Candidatus Omnitrophota bacterium]
FLVLCYHDIPKQPKGDLYAVDQESFVQTLEYLKIHGYHFIGMDDILAAKEGKRELPEKAVLLTFDDAYKSFYDFAFPLLKRYQYPCVLAVVTKWMDKKPRTLAEYQLMNWEELEEVAKSDLVEIASHSHDLHQGVIYNPQDNEAAAAISRIYDPETQSYESKEDYLERIGSDLVQSRAILKQRLAIEPRILCWPYGRYSGLSLETANKFGFEFTFALDDRIASINNLDAVSRISVSKNPAILEFIEKLKSDFDPVQHLRCVQVDLDLIYDPSPKLTEENLGRVLDRIMEMKVDIVFLQAFSDEEGSGNIKEVYFPNRLLPMKADLFNRVTHQLRMRTQVEVYAWMPMLSIVLPDEDNNSLRVWEHDGTLHFPSRSWYERLSPFNQLARQRIKVLYADMALNAYIDGVVFQDDGYLSDYEDFNPEALPYYEQLLGKRLFLPHELSDEELQKWTQLKTDTLLALTQDLMTVVRFYRPEAKFARTLYATVLLNPETEIWFCQNYSKSLQAYDYVVIMAYPEMERAWHAKSWLRKVLEQVKEHPGGIEKTIFKVQTYDWNKRRWINSKTLKERLRTLVAYGAHHLAYYPDDYTVNQPDAAVIRTMMSVEDFPFKRQVNREGLK